MVKPPPKTYKERKEDFVSNHYGGTISEINLVTAVAPAAYVLYAVLQSRLRFFTPYEPLQFLVDFILNTIAILFSITAYSAYPTILNALILLPAIFIYITSKDIGSRPLPTPAKKPKNESTLTGNISFPKRAFITVYRGSMMAITCIAILAVDFKIFPRRFAKVENWGTSLMDLGVGSFVFSSGVVSAKAVLTELYAFEQTRTKTVKYVGINARQRASKALRSSLPLLVLGFVRLATVKATNYAEHISEYGYHWNFFFTLALLPPFVHLFQSLLFLLPKQLLGIHHFPALYATLAIGIGAIYQIVLENTGLKSFILIGEREPWGLIGWNKEGLFSFIGYLAIFLAGMSTGGYLLPAEHSSGVRKSLVGPLGFKLIGWSIFWIAAFLVSWDLHGLRLHVSRRIANLPYILWIVAFNTAQITAFYLIEQNFFTKGKYAALAELTRYTEATPQVLEAFNREGLPVFLVANVLTGLVNLGFNTLDCTNFQALGILVGYTFALTSFAVGLNRTKWRVGILGKLGI